MTVFILQSN